MVKESKFKDMSILTKKYLVKDTGKTNGEHTLTVIATDSSEDRDHERFNTESLLIPVKGSALVKVTDLKGDEDLDIQAFINHDRDVRSQIGSVQSTQIVDGQLQMVIRLLADDPDADKVYKLAAGGHLGNNVSVTYDMDNAKEINGEYMGATLLEVSIVWRGSNKNAQVLSIKSDKEEKMPVKTKTPEEVQQALESAQQSLSQASDAVDAALAANQSDGDNQPQDNKPTDGENQGTDEPAKDADADTEKTADNAEADKSEVNVKKEAIMPKTKDAKILAKSAGKSTVKPVAETNSGKAWLGTDEAVKSYYGLIKTSASENEFKKAWNAELAAKGITGDDVVPDAVANVYFDVIQKHSGIISAFDQISDKAFAGHAVEINGKARGHKKGEKKTADDVAHRVRRQYAHMLYQRLDLDAIDVYNSPEVANRALRQQLEIMLRDIERASVIGDPVDVDAKDATLIGNEGIWPIKKDTADDADVYGKLVADHYTPVAGEAFDDKVTKAKALLDENSPARIIAVIKKSTETALLTARDKNGRKLVENGDLAAYLNVDEVFAPKWMDEDADNDAYLFLEKGYVLFGQPTPTQKPGFDYDYNRNISLLEMPKGGTLDGSKVAVAIRSRKGE